MLLDIMGYHSQRDVLFLKITLLLPKLIPSAKRVLEQGLDVPGYGLKSYQCFETNIDFDTRYLLVQLYVKQDIVWHRSLHTIETECLL